MDIFRLKKKREERESAIAERAIVQEAIMKLSARLNCAEAMIMALLSTRDNEMKRTAVNAAKGFVADMTDINPPSYVAAEQEQAFRNELSRALQTFIQLAE